MFLDTDVELLNPIDDLFDILKEIDLVGCHAPVRWSNWKNDYVPEGVSELNSGVLGFRRNFTQRALIRKWLKLYDSVGIDFDQATLRDAMWWAIRKEALPWCFHQNIIYEHQNLAYGCWNVSEKIHGRIP